MRVFLIAAVLAVFATSAEARCYPANAMKELKDKGMSKYACDCIKDEITEWMSLYFYNEPRLLGSNRSHNILNLDFADKLANVHAKMCQPPRSK